MKYITTAFLVIFNCASIHAQKKDSISIDSIDTKYHPLFSITTDLAQYGLFQPNIGFEYKIDTLAFGINVGLIEPSPIFAINPLANGQFTDPGTVYSGIAFRFYLKIYNKKHPYSYWSFQAVYKKEAFNNISFSDEYRDEILNTYTMSENGTVMGFEILHGNEITAKDENYTIDLFYGFGYHVRAMNYTISDENTSPTYPGPEYNGLTIALPGTYSSTFSTFTPVIGLRIGWNYLKKE